MPLRSAIAVMLFQLPLLAVTTCQPLAAAEWLATENVRGFEIRANFTLASCPELIPELTKLECDLSEILQLPSRGEPVHLLLFADQKSYIQYMDQYFKGAPQRRAMFIKGSGPGWVMAYVNPNFEIDVRHECTHALLHSRLPLVPLWLDEGLAEYFEVTAEERQKDNPHQTATRWGAWLYRTPNLRHLEELHDVRQMGSTEYRHAWAWVHFMILGPATARDVLCQYLADIACNAPPGNLSERLEAAVPDLQGEFLRHHRQR